MNNIEGQNLFPRNFGLRFFPQPIFGCKDNHGVYQKSGQDRESDVIFVFYFKNLSFR